MTITPQKLGGSEPVIPDGIDKAYRLTNIPSDEATLTLTVNKMWDLGGLGQEDMFEELTVRVALLADGEDTGLTGELSLRNGWVCTFEGLPKYEDGEHEIQYTVEELDVPNEWRVEYGPIMGVGSSGTDYKTTITNIYRATAELPSTGGIGHWGYTMLGSLIILSALGWYCGKRRKSERGEC